MSTATETPRDRPPAGSPRFSWGPDAARLVFLGLPAAATLILALGGGVQDGDWYPWAFVTTLGAGLLLALDLLRPRQGPGVWAALAFLALAVWTLAPTGWALLPGTAFVEGARATFYAATFVVVLTVVRSRRDATWLVALLAAVCGGLSAYALIQFAIDPPASWIVYGRFAWPTGYPNTAASLAVLGAWLSAGVACHRRAPIAARAVAQGTVVLAIGLVVLSQSRGAVYALAICVPLALIVVRERLRLLVPLGVAAIAVIPAVPALHDALTQDGEGLIRHAARVVLVCAIAATLVGAVVALIDSRRTIDEPLRARIGRIALAVTAAVVVAGGAVALAAGGPHRVRTAWDTFSQAGTPTATGSGVRLFSFGSNRYDFWRVALDDAARHPLTGEGAGSFGPSYLQHGRSDETPAQAHGEIFELLGTVGLPGAILGVAIGLIGLAGLSGIVPGARRVGMGDPLLGAAFGAALSVLVHAQADWHWQSAAIAVPVVALLAGGGSLLARERPWAQRWTRLSGALLVVLALAFVLPGLLSVRVEQQAVANSDIGSAHTAATLNPFGSTALLAASSLERSRGDQAGALKDAREATDREPDNWATWIALARASTGAERLKACSRARAANPRLGRCP